MTSRRGDQTEGKEDNQNDMPMAMFMRLQEEFETLKKNNEEKLSMLRAENAYMKQKLNEETVLNATSYETIQPRARIHKSIYNEASFEATRRRQSETSCTFFRTFIRRHPFSEAIIETLLPKN